MNSIFQRNLYFSNISVRYQMPSVVKIVGTESGSSQYVDKYLKMLDEDEVKVLCDFYRLDFILFGYGSSFCRF